MLEIRLINENPESLFYLWADVIWIWLARSWGLNYKSQKKCGQHRLHLGKIIIW